MQMHEQQERLRRLINSKTKLFRDANDNFWDRDGYRFDHPKCPEKMTLHPLLGEGVSLQSMVDARRAQGKNIHVLELFGSAEFLLDPYSADSITGVRLIDVQYDDSERSRPRPPHHNVLERDMYDKKIFEDLVTHMGNNNIPSMDLAVCAPVGAFWRQTIRFPLPVHLSIYYPMLQNVYSLLSSDGGTILTEIPHGIYPDFKDLKAWEDRMNRKNIPTRVVWAEPDLERNHLAQITKLPDSPKRLVRLAKPCSMPAKK